MGLCCIKLLIAAVQQFALITAKPRGNWACFGFKMTTEIDVMLDEMFLVVFAKVEYILLEDNDILQSVCELECYAQSAIEPKINYCK